MATSMAEQLREVEQSARSAGLEAGRQGALQVVEEARLSLERENEAAQEELSNRLRARAEEIYAEAVEGLRLAGTDQGAEAAARAAAELEVQVGEALSAIQSAAEATAAHASEVEVQTRNLADERAAAEDWIREAARHHVAEQVSAQVEEALEKLRAESASPAGEEMEARLTEVMAALQAAAEATEAHVKEVEASTARLGEARSATEDWLRETAERHVAEQVGQRVEAEEATQAAERARREAETRLASGVDDAISSLRAETERLRSEAVNQASDAEARLAAAVEQSRQLAEGRLQQELERMLDNLLRDVRTIGDRLSEE
jgi:uncharacterized protein YqgV (UPF0045/DUF77 family)